jgi:hypothetical protein
MWDTTALNRQFSIPTDKTVKIRGIPHLAKNERDAPNFLHAALDRTMCAPFFEERRMKFAEPTKLHRKSGMWGTRRSWKVKILIVSWVVEILTLS